MLLVLLLFRLTDDRTCLVFRSVFAKGTLRVIKVFFVARSLSADRFLISVCLANFFRKVVQTEKPFVFCLVF